MMVEEDTSTSEDSLPTKFYNPGSTISLTCIVRHSLIKNTTVTEMTNLTWKKDKVVVEIEENERMRKVLPWQTKYYNTDIIAVCWYQYQVAV